MGSSFLKAALEQEAYIDKLIQEREGAAPVTYSMMQAQGQLKPFTVRLPVTTLAILDKLQRHGLWSKQEMVYKMIQSAIEEYYEAADKQTRADMDKVANEALEAWGKKNKRKTFDVHRGAFVATSKSKAGKRGGK